MAKPPGSRASVVVTGVPPPYRKTGCAGPWSNPQFRDYAARPSSHIGATAIGRLGVTRSSARADQKGLKAQGAIHATASPQNSVLAHDVVNATTAAPRATNCGTCVDSNPFLKISKNAESGTISNLSGGA